MKSGFVSFIGRPNVGKSTLLNSILGKRVAITSDKPQTTRNLIQGIYNDEETQIVFVDTPGIHKPQNKLGRVLNKQTYFTINDVDVVIMVVDITEKIGKGDSFVIDILKNINDKPVFLVINKIDKLPREEILKKIDEYQKLYDFTEIIPVSARRKDNVERLISVIRKYLPDNILYYDKDSITDSTDEFIISEFIREKVLDLTEEEVPHSVTVIVENIHEEDNILVDLTIEDDKPSVKEVTMGDALEYFEDLGLEYNVDYVDASKDRAMGRRSKEEYDDVPQITQEIPIVDEELEAPKEESKSVNLDSDDNLFDLIDSMYKEND